MLLKQLSEANGLPGREDRVRDLIKDAAGKQADTVRTDVMGNVIATCKSRGPAGESQTPVVMITAHMDEVGLVITHIEKDGFLRFTAVGSIDSRLLVSKPVVVGRDSVPGVIGAKAIHLQKPDERKKPIPEDDLFIDIGARDKEDAEKLVELGDDVYFTTEFGQIGNNCVKGKAFDDRVGCALLLDLLQDRYQSFQLEGTFTVQEEVGLRGSGVAAYSVNPDLAIVLEGTTASDVVDIPEHRHATTLGLGPALTVMDGSAVTNQLVLQRLRKVAENEKIEYQLRRTTRAGTDAGRIGLTRGGVPVGVVSVPCRYIHSPVSIMNKDDYDSTRSLLRAFLKSIDEGGMPV